MADGSSLPFHDTLCNLTSGKCWVGNPPSQPHLRETGQRHRKLITVCHCSQPPPTSAQALLTASLELYIDSQAWKKHELGHPFQSPTSQRLFPYFILAIVLSYLVSPTHLIASTTV